MKFTGHSPFVQASVTILTSSGLIFKNFRKERCLATDFFIHIATASTSCWEKFSSRNLIKTDAVDINTSFHMNFFDKCGTANKIPPSPLFRQPGSENSIAA